MIYSVGPVVYKSGHLRPLSPLEVLGEFAKNQLGQNFPAAVIIALPVSYWIPTTYDFTGFPGHT